VYIALKKVKVSRQHESIFLCFLGGGFGKGAQKEGVGAGVGAVPSGQLGAGTKSSSVHL
jgi:hypothetical protein